LSASFSEFDTTRFGVVSTVFVAELGVAPEPPSVAALIVAVFVIAVPSFKGDFTVTSNVMTQLVPSATVIPVTFNAVPELLFVELPQFVRCTFVRFCVSVSIVSVALMPVPCPSPVFFRVNVYDSVSPGSTFPPLISLTDLVLVDKSGVVSTVNVSAETGAGLLPPSAAAATSTLLVNVPLLYGLLTVTE
jgi:hypothetical protein